jgi:hypothetical protein
MLRASTGILLALALVACSDNRQASVGNTAGDAYASEEMQMAMPPMAAPAPSFTEASKAAMGGAPVDLDRPIIDPGPNGNGGGAPPGTSPLMAYTYNWNFAVPTNGMEPLQAAHKKLCEDAGPANCYVTNSSLDAIGQKEGASGILSMRATEPWVRKFEAGVNEGLKPFGASVYSTNRGAEELTAQIVDNEARLRSMTAHRDALQKMLDDKPGRLSDLLEIQQALAQSQGEIDARQSLVAALRLRVSMSVITFYYQAEYAPAAQSIWRPVTDAFGDFVPAFARTLGAIIEVVAALLPILVFGAIAVAVLTYGYRWWSRRRVRKAERRVVTEKATSAAKS